mgnify:CR=1 FL=1
MSAFRDLLFNPVVLGSLAFSIVLAVVMFLATAGSRRLTRCIATSTVFALGIGAGLQFL